MVIHKIITILSQNLVYEFETVEMGLFDYPCVYLGKFFYIDKKRLDWLDSNAIRVFANYICGYFFIGNWV